MKLLYLNILDLNGFRSLKHNFRIDFHGLESGQSPFGFDPYCFIGKNGSGKSNVLEAIANIFYHIECIYLENKPDDFEEEINGKLGFSPELCAPDAFILEYIIPVPWVLDKNEVDINVEFIKLDANFAHIQISKELNKIPEIKILNNKMFLDINSFADRITIKQMLPELIVGYSSGENETLSLPFFKMRFLHYDEYETLLKKKQPYGRPEGRMFYLDNQYSQAILLSNFLLQDADTLEPFKNKNIDIGIEEIVQFRLIIKQHHKIRFSEEIIESLTSKEISSRKDFDLVELTSNIRTSVIDKFISCSTSVNYEKETESLILDYCITPELSDPTKKAFGFHFNNDPLELFRSFHILLTLNQYHVDQESKREVYNSNSLYVNETIATVASNNRIFRIKDLWIKKRKTKEIILSKALSDGEHQFLHSMGICMLLKNTNSVFLFDEPETHFNPQWRAKFISTLRICLGDKKNIARDIFITTHSPFIISDCKKENVKWFLKEKNDGPQEVVINTFGTSIGRLMNEFFGKQRQIADRAWNEMLQDLESNDISELNDSLSKFGESPEKNMLLEKLNRIIFEKGLE